MTLPASFLRDGFVAGDKLRKRRRMMIGSDGWSDSGKTEFILSAPGPGIVIALDRGYDAMLDNPDPPPWRGKDFAFKSISVPLATQAAQPVYLEYWRAFYAEFKKALENADAVTVGLDGDSDSWELQRLAEFGKLTQIPPIMYTSVNCARRAMIARAWDSGKIIIATNKVKHAYEDEFDVAGKPVMGSDGKPKRTKSGDVERQGFSDQDYLWQIQIRHLFREARVNPITKKEVPKTWGLRVMKAKANKEVEGTELWGPDCNFAGLMQLVYPHIGLEEWGFK